MSNQSMGTMFWKTEGLLAQNLFHLQIEEPPKFVSADWFISAGGKLWSYDLV